MGELRLNFVLLWFHKWWFWLWIEPPNLWLFFLWLYFFFQEELTHAKFWLADKTISAAFSLTWDISFRRSMFSLLLRFPMRKWYKQTLNSCIYFFLMQKLNGGGAQKNQRHNYVVVPEKDQLLNSLTETKNYSLMDWKWYSQLSLTQIQCSSSLITYGLYNNLLCRSIADQWSTKFCVFLNRWKI